MEPILLVVPNVGGLRTKRVFFVGRRCDLPSLPGDAAIFLHCRKALRFSGLRILYYGGVFFLLGFVG